MGATKICYLLNKESLKKIYLNNKEIKIIGRNPESEIKDTFVSKEQIMCIADTEKCLVSVKSLGRSTVGIDGYATVKGKMYTVGHGHIIELRLGFHEYKIVFDPPPDKENVSGNTWEIFNMKTVTNKEENVTSLSGIWELIDNKELLIYTPTDMQHTSKIASFDVDGTIIKTKSGKRFPTSTDDWVLNFSKIPLCLKELYKDNFKIVFFTNQSGVGNDSTKINDFKTKIETILKTLSVPVQVFVALKKTIYRKPMLGMWHTLENCKNVGTKIDKNNSFYVGDAAGREDSWAPQKKKDHSSADRFFAINVGIKFYTPEEYFLKSKPVSFSMPEFDPRNLPIFEPPKVDEYKNPNVILMVGGPGSGKSHFCKKILIPKDYVYINRDKLGTWQKCVKFLENALLQKKNCVIDNTNVDKESRFKFIDICKRNKVDCYCFVMLTSSSHSKHNNKFRELTDKSHVPVSEIIINSMKKKYQDPELSEGFQNIVKIQFSPQFDDQEKEKLYKMFLLET